VPPTLRFHGNTANQSHMISKSLYQKKENSDTVDQNHINGKGEEYFQLKTIIRKYNKLSDNKDFVSLFKV
jgi:hypothetical protein